MPGEANVEDKVHSSAHGEACGVARGHNSVVGEANDQIFKSKDS